MTMGYKIKLFCMLGVALFTFFNLFLATIFMNYIALMIFDLNLVVANCFIFFMDDVMDKFKKKKRRGY